MILLQTVLILIELFPILVKLLLRGLELPTHLLFLFLKVRMFLIDGLGLLECLPLLPLLSIRQSHELVVVDVTSTRVLVVGNDSQLVQVLLHSRLQLLLQLLDGLLPSTLRIQNLIVHVHFLLRLHVLVILALSLFREQHLSLILVFPDKLTLPILLLLEAFLQALGFVLRFLQ